MHRGRMQVQDGVGMCQTTKEGCGTVRYVGMVPGEMISHRQKNVGICHGLPFARDGRPISRTVPTPRQDGSDPDAISTC